MHPGHRCSSGKFVRPRGLHTNMYAVERVDIYINSGTCKLTCAGIENRIYMYNIQLVHVGLK